MKRLLAYLSILMSLLSGTGCQHSINSEKALYQWMHQEENGLIKTRQANHLSITVKYLPARYLALRDIRNLEKYDEKKVHALVEEHKKSYAFLLTIQPDKSGGAEGDVLYQGVENYREYKQRVMQLNFGIGNYVSIKAGGQEYKPVLSTLENTYSVTNHRSIYLVFSENETQRGLLEAENIDFVFDDELFGTGINHFVFDKETLQQLPPINYQNFL